MALFIKRKSDGVVFNSGQLSLDGGIVVAFQTGINEYCPIIVYDDAINQIGDSITVQTPKAVSEEYWAYSDTFEADPSINPDLTAKPVLGTLNPDKYYTVANSATSTTTFKILLDNPNNYQVQFSTNVEGSGGVAGGVDNGGYPVGWANIAKDNAGYYLVRTISHNTNQQTVWIRYRRAGDTGYSDTYRIGPNFTPMPVFGNGGTGTGTGGGGTPIGTALAVPPVNGVNVLAHVWPMMGNRDFITGEEKTTQKTYQDDILAAENLAAQAGFGNKVFNRFPWYTVRNNSPKQYETSVWGWNANTNRFEDTGQSRTSVIYHEFHLSVPVMKLYVEYAVRAGIQGFAIMSYANDAYLGNFRRFFRALTNAEKRGLKVCYSLLFGDNGRDRYDEQWNDLSVANVYRDTLHEFANDMKEEWYATAKKVINGVPTQVPIVYLLVDNMNQARIDEYWQDLQRIKNYRINTGKTPITETFNILMTTGGDIVSGQADDLGNTFNATTYYYNQPSKPFSNALNTLNANSSSNKVPMLSWGYDSRARDLFHTNEITGNHFDFDTEVLPFMPTLLNRLNEIRNDVSKDVRVALVGQVGEYVEQGQDLFPSYNNGLAPLTTLLDIFKSIFNPNYQLPI